MARTKLNDPSEVNAIMAIGNAEFTWLKLDDGKLIAMWSNHLEQKLAPRTIRKYERDFVEFWDWFERLSAERLQDKPSKLVYVDQTTVKTYIHYCLHNRIIRDTRDGEWYHAPLSASSRKAVLSAIRSFYRWMAYRFDDWHLDPTDGIDRPSNPDTTVGEVLTRQELEQLLRCPTGSARETITVYLLAYTGCRVQEIADLRWSDVDLDNGFMTVRGKGRKVRTVDILDELHQQLTIWRASQRLQATKAMQGADASPVLTALDTPGSDYVLLTKTGKRCAQTSIWRCLKRRAYRAGVRPLEASKNKHGRTKDMQSEVSPHMLRRTLATILFEEGVHIEDVATILGHESSSTTKRHYLNPRDDRRRAAMEKFTLIDRQAPARHLRSA